MVPENIHSHPKEGINLGSLKSQNKKKIKKIKMKLINRNFQRGGGSNQKTFIRGGGMDIFWNNMIQLNEFLAAIFLK